jgi:hypothetical protein
MVARICRRGAAIIRPGWQFLDLELWGGLRSLVVMVDIEIRHKRSEAKNYDKRPTESGALGGELS